MTRAASPEVPVDDTLQATGLADLTTDSPADAVESALRKLADHVNSTDVDDLRRETLRDVAIRALKEIGWTSPARAVDAAFGRPEREAEAGSGKAMVLREVDAWSSPVSGSDLLDELAATFRRFIALPDGGPESLALWVLFCYAHDAFQVSPLLGITSPEKRCGKSTTMFLIGALVPRALPASNITTAALFRAVEAMSPTLLVDEADTFLAEREELRGVLNSGHVRAGAVVVRTVGDDHEPRTFSTWAPKAIALIGSLPSTLEDRSILIRMRRRSPGEVVERLRLDRLDVEFKPIRMQATRWAEDHIDALALADPDMPPELHDRAADNWRPLVAIAEAAGGDWPRRARTAAKVLSGTESAEDSSIGVMILTDVKRVFDRLESDRIASSRLAELLADMEERPWPEWRRGKPITGRSIARLLHPFEVQPNTLRFGDSVLRGYARAQFDEAWKRYLPPDPPVEVQQPQQRRTYAENGGSPNRNTDPDVALRETTENPRRIRDVADVALPEADPGQTGSEFADLFNEGAE